MEEVMQSNSFFIIPLTLAYLSICALWFLFNRYFSFWPIRTIQSPQKPYLEMFIAMIASVAIIAIGQLYSAGFLIPSSDNAVLSGISWVTNNIIIFSPIFITLWWRKHTLSTVFLSGSGWLLKLSFGIVSALIGVVIFSAIRNEWSKIPDILSTAIEPTALVNFPAVFFENVALAFLFVRLKWAAGIKWAIIIPSILFALAHVPGSLAEGDPWSHIVIFFFVTGSLTVVILYTVYRSRDIIWLGIVHYLMDVAIKAF